jgi:hypothetical protein
MYDEDADINRAWENIRENMNVLATESTSYYELKLKRRKTLFDESFQNYYVKGTRINCGGCRNEAKHMQII